LDALAKTKFSKNTSQEAVEQKTSKDEKDKELDPASNFYLSVHKAGMENVDKEKVH
jgi:hypothetical protein